MARRHAKPGTVVIGVGASAGGVTALKELLRGLPTGSGWIYVVVLHTDPTRRSLLASILNKETALLVKTIDDGERPQPETVYVVPSDRDCVMRAGKLRLLDLPEPAVPRHSIDVMLSSLAEVYGERSAGIVLSGTGSDGLHGMLAIKAAGGIAIAQDPKTAAYSGMPQAVIDAGLADLVLAPARIGGELLEILRQPLKVAALGAVRQTKDSLEGLLTALSRKTRCDFSQYKETMLTRRIERRMAVHKLSSLKDYTALVEASDSEADLLFKDILISVTGFFRDPADFEVLGEAVKRIVERKSSGEPIRIWVPGCATGEEAFSIAILLAEALGKRSSWAPIQIFASDVDTGAIAFARRGLYLETSIKTIPKPLLEKYFTKAGGLYQVAKTIRDMVVFARHDLMLDAPFTKLDLVSCRNVLIYFIRPLQERLVPLFHYSLNPDGYLVLGTSEDVGQFTDLFRPVAAHCKVFARIGNGRKRPATLPHVAQRRAERPQRPPKRAPSVKGLYRTLLAEAYAPPGLFVNGRFEVVHVQGDVSRFVRLPPGDLTINVIDMAIAPLRLETRLVLQKAQRERVVVRGRPTELKDAAGSSRVTLIAIPVPTDHEGGGQTLLLLEELRIDQPSDAAGPAEEDHDSARSRQLEQELTAIREQLQTSIEELETANEDFQSVNEEYQSTAEELQSANEELQSTNEELQSTNEELLTVNEELKTSAETLEVANTDLENILNTVLSGVVVLDRDCRVTRYSAASRQVFDLLPSSIGRPLVGVDGSLDLSLLMGEIEKVARSATPMERDMALGDKIFAVKLIPLQQSGGAFSGMVITFNDETKRKLAERDTHRLATIVRDSNDAVAVLGLDGRILAWNRGAEKLYGYGEVEALELNVSALLPKQRQAEMSQLIERLVHGKEVKTLETTRLTKDGQKRDIWLTATPLLDEGGRTQAIATIERDLTEIRKLVAVTKVVHQADRNKTEFIARMSHELRTPLNAIIGFSEVIKSELFGPPLLRRYADYAKDIHASGLHLLALVNDVLDLSKVEADEFELEEELLELPEIAEEMLHMLRLEAEKRGVSLSIEMAADLPKLKSDRRAIRQILINLLNNAVDFTPSGGQVVLKMCLDRDDRLEIAVCDTGVGILDKDISKAMKPFAQLSNSRDTSRVGTGLGLSIVSGLAKLLEAKLDVSSEVGTGTTVTVGFAKTQLFP